MEITFNELKEKEIINVADGKKLGRVEDVIFDKDRGTVVGIVIPGEKRLFRRSEDIFIPIEELKRIGEDVILVKLNLQSEINSLVVKDNKNQLKRLRIEPEKEK